MKASKIFNKLSTTLEEQVAQAIADLMDEHNLIALQFNPEANNWKMCFYPDKVMTGLHKFTDAGWIVETEDDTTYELFDNGMLPLPDLLAILEEIENHIHKQ